MPARQEGVRSDGDNGRTCRAGLTWHPSLVRVQSTKSVFLPLWGLQNFDRCGGALCMCALCTVDNPAPRRDFVVCGRLQRVSKLKKAVAYYANYNCISQFNNDVAWTQMHQFVAGDCGDRVALQRRHRRHCVTAQTQR